MIAWSTVQAALQAWVVSASGLSSSKVFWAQQNLGVPSDTYIDLLLERVERVGQDWRASEFNVLEFSDVVVTAVDTVANSFTKTAHGLLTGDGPVRFESSGTMPGGVAADLDYWIIRVNADSFKLALTFPLARAGTAVDVTSAGTGTRAVVSTENTLRAGEEVTRYVRGLREFSLVIRCFGTAPVGSSAPAAILDLVQAKSRLPTIAAALRVAGVGLAGFSQILVIDEQVGSLIEPRAQLVVRGYLAQEVSEVTDFVETVEVESEISDETFTVDFEY